MAYDFSSLDFDSLKEDIVAFIKEDDNFKDYNFEGSALNSIANFLTYITMQQNFYLNMTTKELYLSSAQLYRNAASIAKSLNYIPHRSKSAMLQTEISVDPDKWNNSITEIPQHCKFLVNGYPFITTQSANILSSNEPVQIDLYQMTIKTETFTYNDLPLELAYGQEIDNEYLSVKVNGVLWEEYLNISEVENTSQIYFVNLNYNGKIEISFGNNVFGKSPGTDASIEVVYGITKGAEANNLKNVKLDQDITDGTNTYTSSDVVFSNTIASSSGSDKESIDSIKLNAPKFYEAHGRAITENDYKVFVEQLTYVDKANVWSGTNNIQPTYGTVFIAPKPKDIESSLTISSTQKQDLYDHVKQYSPLSIRVQVEDPFYIYIDIDSTVYYYKSYGVSTTSLRGEIQENIIDYFDNKLNIFNSRLKYSRLVNVIDTPSAISNNLTELTYFIKFDQSPNDQYHFYIRNAIVEGSIVNDYIYDSGGIIYLISDDSAVGEINYSTGYIKINTTLGATDNILKFKFQSDDALFEQKNLPILNDINVTFKAV